MHQRLLWAQAACSRVLRPLVRLALAMGLKHPHLEDMLRDLLLDEARRLWQSQGVARPNISQLAITTGLNRKEVTQRVRATAAETLSHTELSAASKTFTLWLQLASRDAAYRRLTTASSGAGTSFESVARQASRGDVHHRAVLDELVRLGLATEQEGSAELAAEAFVPSKDLQTMLAFLGDNVRDHLQAAVANVAGDGRPPLLERAVFSDGLSPEACEQLEQLARQRWSSLHHELVDRMTAAMDHPPPPQMARRMRIGIYAYYEEDAPAAGRPASASEENTP